MSLFILSLDQHRRSDGLTDRHAWVEGRVGVLEYNLHPGAHGLHLALGESGDILPIKEDFSTGRLMEAQDRPAQGGFPTS